MTREIIARAPTRIDLGGGWTDVPPYCDREGGFVCNVAITRYASARLTDSEAAQPGSRERFTNGDGGDAPLVRAAIRRSGVEGIDVEMHSDFPVASGLGGSSAASAALLGALAAWKGEPWRPADIAETGRRIEVEDLGVPGGRQDHYAATHGGALALTFTSGVDVRRIPLSQATRAELVSRSILIYTGQSRVSGDTITAVLGAYEAGEPRVIAALRRMRELAGEMAEALRRGDIDAIGELLNEHWTHQRSLHPTISTERIDDIVRRARTAGALGAKAMGASGGGCVLIVARRETAEIRAAVAELGEFVDFDIDDTGLAVMRETA